jgi:hypothetical protein
LAASERSEAAKGPFLILGAIDALLEENWQDLNLIFEGLYVFLVDFLPN